MSYSVQVSGLGFMGSLGEVRRMASGQEVTVRVRPVGVNAKNQTQVFDELLKAIIRTGVLRSPKYLGWGAGENAGFIVYKANTATDRYTLREIANLMSAAVRKANEAIGQDRMVFSVVKSSEAARGPLVDAPPSSSNAPAPPQDIAQPPPPSAPPAAPPAAPSASLQPSDHSQSDDEGFFGKKIAGIPVWALGAGMLVLGAGAVFLATRRKAAA